jgi:hypothetical protein
MRWRTQVLSVVACWLAWALPSPVIHAAPGASDKPREAAVPASTAERASVTNLREGAKRGDAQSQYDLAVALDCGRGVKRNRAEALEWLRQAASQGHVAAQSALGWKYMAGEGVSRDDVAAFQWLRRAAERGNTSAQNNLGILYATGRGVAADPAEAAKWFRLAAEKGAVDAQRNLDALQDGRQREVRPTADPSRSRT